jgi:hypothetical protein
MRKEAILDAKAEAKRFLNRVKEYEEVERLRPGWQANPMESGALRRSSMDLTRALAFMRRSS